MAHSFLFSLRWLCETGWICTVMINFVWEHGDYLWQWRWQRSHLVESLMLHQLQHTGTWLYSFWCNPLMKFSTCSMRFCIAPLTWALMLKTQLHRIKPVCACVCINIKMLSKGRATAVTHNVLGECNRLLSNKVQLSPPNTSLLLPPNGMYLRQSAFIDFQVLSEPRRCGR